MRRPATLTRFPYTTLFRSMLVGAGSGRCVRRVGRGRGGGMSRVAHDVGALGVRHPLEGGREADLGGGIDVPPRSEEHTSNSSHTVISYAVICLKKKKTQRV